MSVKITIEVSDSGAVVVNNANSTTQVSSANTSAGYADTNDAWTLLVNARGNLRNAIENGNSFDVDKINQWIGGGVAALAAIRGVPAQELLDELVAVAPVVTNNSSSTPSRAKFVPSERERAEEKEDFDKLHAGRQRTLDVSSLSPEEREELGIVLPDDESTEDAEEDLDLLDEDVLIDDEITSNDPGDV